MSRITTARGVLRRGVELWKKGELDWASGTLFSLTPEAKKASDRRGYSYDTYRDNPDATVVNLTEVRNPQNVGAVCATGMVRYIIAQLPDASDEEKKRLYNEAIDLLNLGIDKWATASDKGKQLYRDYVAELAKKVDKILEQYNAPNSFSFSDLFEDDFYDEDVHSIKGKLELVVEPLSFDDWVDSEDARDRGFFNIESMVGENKVIEFNDSIATKDDVLAVFKKAARL